MMCNAHVDHVYMGHDARTRINWWRITHRTVVDMSHINQGA
jgi:hypothetical protein